MNFEAGLLAWVSDVVGEEIHSMTPVDSNEINAVFRLNCAGRSLFLKTGPDLQREYHKIEWLAGRLPAPQPITFMAFAAKDAFLMSAVDGENLACLKTSLTPQIIIRRLAAALKALHATRADDWPFEKKEGGLVLVHGDACLPNFMYRGDHLSGYIDVGDMAVADPAVDLAAAVWSLQYNLGPGHGLSFLREYGLQHATEEDVERLRLLYE